MTPLALSHPAPSRRARLTAGFGAAWRAVRPHLLVLLPILLLAGSVAAGISAWSASRTNAGIAALEAGRDVAVAPDAPAALSVARIKFLAARDRLEEAEPLLESLDRNGATDSAARARYVLANARVRQAFDLIGRGELDKAGPQVTLARQDYRRALQARPDFWDAKFNFDVASRLIRDFPEFDRKFGDELKAEPKQIWTDIPGQPRGGP
ncbi:MxaK protein [Methylorubrum salsuginis]|uniref:MxaK protein n=1 Tax=Methylorubrum salsuginis TaxID=414703 RepID=A0A1I4BG71_9HYPH|nr:MxaK protein [Methylorubrum salsuginis]SFK66956.1 mxaK protein [Methylorubrum salsuginis]